MLNKRALTKSSPGLQKNSLPTLTDNEPFTFTRQIVAINVVVLAGAAGLEPAAYGFGDRHSTN